MKQLGFELLSWPQSDLGSPHDQLTVIVMDGLIFANEKSVEFDANAYFLLTSGRT